MDEQRGVPHRIEDPEAEVQRLSRQRQVAARQICAEQDRACDAACEIGPAHCPYHHEPRHRRIHDPDHCDRVWSLA